MKRNDWQFEYTAHVLADAATRKKTHHAERAAWWEEKKKEVIAAVKADGLQMTESLAVQYASLAATHGAQLSIKGEYQNQLSECHMKIKMHNDTAKEYDAWIQLLTANPEKQIGLDVEDYRFFFGS